MEDNYCSNLIFCFLTQVDYGLRLRGGIGELLKKVSFERNPGTYAARLIYDLIFFILIVVLMLELVFGIIVETFRELRMEQHEMEVDRANICFICGIHRDELEKDRKDFTEHCASQHNVWNYVNYMIRLKFSDPQDLNAVNSYALAQIQKKNISWMSLNDNLNTESKAGVVTEKEKEELEKDVEINDEHIQAGRDDGPILINH